MIDTLLAPAIIAALIAAGVTLWVHSRNTKQLRTNAKEIRKQPLLAKQLDLGLEASKAASILATTTSAEAFDSAHSRFLELFWGPLAVVEDHRVSAAMITFREKLDKLIESHAPLPLNGLEGESYDLAIKVRELFLEAGESKN